MENKLQIISYADQGAKVIRFDNYDPTNESHVDEVKEQITNTYAKLKDYRGTLDYDYRLHSLTVKFFKPERIDMYTNYDYDLETNNY